MALKEMLFEQLTWMKEVMYHWKSVLNRHPSYCYLTLVMHSIQDNTFISFRRRRQRSDYHLNSCSTRCPRYFCVSAPHQLLLLLENVSSSFYYLMLETCPDLLRILEIDWLSAAKQLDYELDPGFHRLIVGKECSAESTTKVNTNQVQTVIKFVLASSPGGRSAEYNISMNLIYQWFLAIMHRIEKHIRAENRFINR